MIAILLTGGAQYSTGHRRRRDGGGLTLSRECGDGSALEVDLRCDALAEYGWAEAEVGHCRYAVFGRVRDVPEA